MTQSRQEVTLMPKLGNQENISEKPSAEVLSLYATLAKKSLEEKITLTQKAIETDTRLANMVKLSSEPAKRQANATGVVLAQFAIAFCLCTFMDI